MSGTLVVVLAALALGGFATAARPDDQPGADLARLTLEELLAVKTTTASKLLEPADRAPSTVYVITADQIERLGLRDLADVLALVAGVDTVDPHFFLEGGQRGFIGNFSQTLILVDGREMNNLIAGETFISNQFRTHNVRQIEIVNGPGSALYGANAVAGVINVITRSAAGFDGVEIRASRGSWGTTEVDLLFGKEAGGVRLAGAASLFRTRGENHAEFLSDTSRASPLAENNAYRRLPDAFAYENEATAIPVSLLAEKAGFYLGTEYYMNLTGRGTSGIQWDYTQGEDHRELWLGYTGFRKQGLRGGNLDLKLEYRRYQEKFWGNHTEANAEGPLVDPLTGKRTTLGATDAEVEATRGFYSDKRSAGSRRHIGAVESTWRLGERNTLVAGLNLERTEVVAARFSQTEGLHPRITPSEMRPEYSNDKLGVFVEHQARLLAERLLVTAGGRFEHLERSGRTFNPRVGVVYRAGKGSTLKLLYGEAFREPNVFEISHGAEGLGPLKSRTLELAWHQSLGDHVRNQAVAFRNWTSDLIIAVCATEPPPPCFLNEGTSTGHGFEDVVSFKAGRLSGFLNYTFTTAEIDEADALKQRVFGARHRVFDVPRHKANLALAGSFGDVSVGLTARYRSAVETEHHLRRFTVPRWLVLDLRVGLDRIPGFPGTALEVIGRNLFDTRYSHPEPRAPTVVEHPQAGRSLTAALRIRI